MKRWLALALVGLGVCLLLGLTEARTSVPRGLYITGWGRSLGPWGEPALASPAAPFGENRGPRQARAAAPESLAVDLVLLTERGVGPPWLDGRGPPGGAAGTRVDCGTSGQVGSLEAKGDVYSNACSRTSPRLRRGFCNRL
jgi:hypothetical protein